MTPLGAEGAEDHGHPKRWWALSVLCLALGIVAIDNSILNVALPSIASDLDASDRDLQWITAAYGLVLAGLLLPLGVVGDRRGRRGLLVLGLVVFGVASAAGSQASSSGELVTWRSVMGVGGACTMPATLSLIGTVFPPHERGRAIAIWSSVAGASGAAGPVAGGLLVEHHWWGSALLVTFPIAVVGVVGAFLLVPTSRDLEAPAVDRRSAFAWWAAFTALLLAVIELPERGGASPVVLGAFAAAAALFVGFRRNERRSPTPLIEARTARDPRLAAGALTMGVLFALLLGGQFVLTRWLQESQGLSPLEAGLCFLPNALASMAFSLGNTPLARRVGHGRLAAAGVGIGALGSVVAAAAVSIESVPLVAVATFLIGAAIGTGAPSGTELIMSSAPPTRAGSAAGVNETIVEAGGAFGVGVLGSILVATSYAPPLAVAGLVAAGLAAVLGRLGRPRQPVTAAVPSR